MQNENKYVPPHLRGNETYSSNEQQSKSGYERPYSNQRWKDDYKPQSNDYRNNYESNSGGYGSRPYGNDYGRNPRNSYSKGGYSKDYSEKNFYSSGPRTNELGFHGDMRPNPKVEDDLFFKNESQTTGINFDKYDNIPVEVSSGCPEPYNEFTVDTIGPQLLKNLVLTKYTRPTPIQKYSIPIGLMGGDMMACAQTGSGKTAGFLFPLIAIMTKNGPLPEPENRRSKGTYITALVLAPTRELAVQIHEEAQKFCYCTGIRPVVVYGGANIQNQQRDLDIGADVLVATPGRLVDLIERGRVKLDIVQFLVLDEADRMLDMGFEPQIRRIVQEEGMPVDRQTFMFSATFPNEIQRLAGDFMRNYIFVAVGRVGAASKDVSQRVEWVEQNDKVQFVIDFLSRVPEGLVLVFVETKRGADYLEEVLAEYNFPASSIHGDKSQKEREDALKLFKSGRTPILVATDVAARGLDIPNVTQVINFDLPSNIDDYVHRIGRTGRAGNVGHALSLMNDKNRNIAKDLLELLVENQQEIPKFLERMVGASSRHTGYGGRGGGRTSGGRGGNKFGAKDYRRDSDTSSFSAKPSSAGAQYRPKPQGNSRYYGSQQSDSRANEGGFIDGDNSAW